MSSIEKLNYNAEEWYITGVNISDTETKDISADGKKKQKKHSKTFFVLCPIVIVLSVILFFVMYIYFYNIIYSLPSVGIGLFFIIILFIVDKIVMKKRAKKNSEKIDS